ncbi:MAG: DUF1697 domain-containing protein [Caulobacteraceae bacterium]
MALTAHVALLRAVNVGGRGKVAMADLRAMLADLSFEAPQSLLQSGNLVFRSQPTGAALEALLEKEAEARLGLATDFLVRTAAEWADVVAANPYPAMARDDPGHLLVMPLKAEPDLAGLRDLRSWIPGRELIEAVGRELFIAYPDGVGTSKLTNAAIERRIKTRGTARNWNTTTKLAALLAE